MMPDRPCFVWVDGRFLPADDAHLSAFDRAFQLGDGVFETVRARGGRVHDLAAHLARLDRSAAGLAIPLPADLHERLARALPELLAREGLADGEGDASIRITVSRGSFRGRGLLPPDESVAPTVVAQAWPVRPPPAGHLEKGLHLVASRVRRDPASPLASLKTTSRADHVYARLEARAAGADDALFLTVDGHLSEATTANLFFLTGDELHTPGLDCAILPGTTREWVLGWAGRVGLRRREGRFTVADLLASDEAFLSSSVAGILPVTRFDEQPIGEGRPGPRTLDARRDLETSIAPPGEAA